MNKKLILTLGAAAAVAMSTVAKTGEGLKIYINPGHGGHDADDRNVVIEPYAQGDPEGYWESNSNLTKGLILRDMLQAKGYTVVMSRVTNTSDDDLGLSTIVRLANESNADLFFSIHSNATGTVNRRNQPLMLYRGWDDAPDNPEDKVVAQILNKYLLENQTTVWTATGINVRGDWSFYPQWNGAGLGVLRGNKITGMLSEGSFHDYVPEAYRLMNDDFCWLEAWHFRKAIDEYLGVEGLSVGAVAGRLNDTRFPRDGQYVKFGDDKLAAVLGATVQLCDTQGNVLQSYTTETKHVNGYFLFKDVQPGTYIVKASSGTHYPAETTVTVTADQVSYANMTMDKVRSTPPVVESYSPVWKDGDEPVLCNEPVRVTFNWDMDTEATEKAFSISPAVQGAFSWEDLNCTLVFTPTQPYDINTVYTVTVSTEAAHGAGMKMEQSVSFQFKTQSTNYMSILGSFPKQDEQVHYKNATIEFRFDSNPNTAPILNQISCTDSQGNAVSFNKRSMKHSSASDNYGYFRIPFLKDLTVGETYNLTLSGEFANKDGLTIPEPVNITFTAVDAKHDNAGNAVVDAFGDAAAYTYDAGNSVNTSAGSVAKSSSDKLFDGATKFTYAFSADEGSEARFGRTAAADRVINPSDVIGVHINGDLTGNTVYLELTSDVSTQFVRVADMDFLGWRYVEVPASVAEGPSHLTAVKVVQEPSQMSHSGAFMLENVTVSEGAGIDDLVVNQSSDVTVHPNPASDYLVANAGVTITGVTLVGLNGNTVAQANGNVLNVASVPNGTYLLLVRTGYAIYAHKVIVKH